MQEYIKIHPADKVAVALCPLKAGTTVSIDGRELALIEDIPQGHKFALTSLKKEEPVIKYGYPILTDVLRWAMIRRTQDRFWQT